LLATIFSGYAVAEAVKRTIDADIAYYTEAMKQDPNNAETYYNRGNAYAKKGNYNMAIADYTVAIWIKPNYADAYLGRSKAYRKKNDYAKAAEDNETASMIQTAEASIKPPSPEPAKPDSSLTPPSLPPSQPSQPPQIAEPPESPKPPPAPVKRVLKAKEAKSLYKASRASYFRAEYTVAYDGFKEIYETFKTGEMAEDALYWMGLSMQDSGQKEDAEILFKTILEKFPKSSKACPAKFRLAGMAEEAGNKEERAAYLQNLIGTKHCSQSNEFHRASDILEKN